MENSEQNGYQNGYIYSSVYKILVSAIFIVEDINKCY